MNVEFAKIRQKYIATFEQKSIDIKHAFGDEDNEIDIPELHELLHKLTGSSGGYGLHDLCDLAKEGMILTDIKKDIDHKQLAICVNKITRLLHQYQQN